MRALAAYRSEALIFVGVFGVTGYFYNGYGWNQTARYDPIWSFVEPGPNRHTLRIDDFVDDDGVGNTGDWARNPAVGEHFYSNKAPGTSLLGIPFYFALYHGERLLGIDPVAVTAVLVNAYLIHLWVTVLPLALSAVFFFRLAGRFAGTRRRALLLTGVLYGGTLMLPYGTSLWGHTTAAAFVVVALERFTSRSRWDGALAGFLVGMAVLTDYGAAPIALALVALAAVSRARRDRLLPLLAGGAAPLVVFAAYHWLLFGSPLALASSYSPAEMVDEARVGGLFGAFSGRALYGLTLSSYRGLFVYMPVLALALVSASRAVREEERDLWWAVAAGALVVLLVNVTFNGWHGGTAAGPRYQLVALPLWVLMLTRAPRGPRADVALYALAGVSAANAFALATTSPLGMGTLHGSELFFSYSKLWTALRVDLGLETVRAGAPLSLGSIHSYPTALMRDWNVAVDGPVMARYATFNLGELVLGLRGTLSLVPVVAGAGAVGTALVKLTGADPDVSSSDAVSRPRPGAAAPPA